jgi:FAD/FMN-containing dehydrogenase
VSTAAAHAQRVAALLHEMRSGQGHLALAKDTSNLFRDRRADARARLDVRSLCHVLAVDAARGTVDAEGMVPYETLTDACLAHGVMPAVVPQLKTITLGGAVAGVGIEATSFRAGLVHEAVEELEVLTGDGRILLCTPANEHADLFFALPNSYGTLGYALRVKSRTLPVRAFVHVEHRPFGDASAYFAAVEEACSTRAADFIDGTMFAPDRLYLTLGRFVDTAPALSDYTYENIYYRSIPQKREDWLATRDFLWRWDTDWFWCSKNLLAQHPLVRRIYGRRRLGSRTYTRIMRWNSRVGLTRALDRLRGVHGESVIQDVDIPIEHAAPFLAFLAREIGIWPVWMCPIGPQANAQRFSLYPLQPRWYVNFGFWDVVRRGQRHEPGHFNRMIEDEAARLGGIKSLYSESCFTRAAFDATYGGDAYRALKRKYDPHERFPALYDKVVLRH